MLEYNEIKERKYISIDGDPYEVLSSHIFRKQQRKPVNATKLRNLLTGKVVERSFHQNEKVHEAEIDTEEMKYLYRGKGEYWFCDVKDPSKRFSLPESLVGEKGVFKKPNAIVSGLLSGGKTIGIQMPVKVDLVVTDAPPSLKGNTAQGGSKQVTLESGAIVSVPLFVNEGDTLRINTETGTYTERAEKH